MQAKSNLFFIFINMIFKNIVEMLKKGFSLSRVGTFGVEIEIYGHNKKSNLFYDHIFPKDTYHVKPFGAYMIQTLPQPVHYHQSRRKYRNGHVPT